MNIFKKIFTTILLLFSHQIFAEERIQDYQVDITVYENAVMRVTENITVNAEGNRIRRGIYRDFPTIYKDRFGNTYRVDFEIEEILRDGNREPFHTRQQSNGVRIYIGQENTFLKNGVYTYSITYRTYRQLGYFDNHDELYWNVTGNDWEFTIEHASATVKLPPGIPFSKITATGYTGPFGSQAQDYRATVTADSSVFFETTRSLPPQNGLTIVAGWPKGHVYEPTTEEKLQYLFRDNRHIFVGVTGLIILLVYYILIWSKVGKDPEKGVIIPQYEPPEGYSPASMRFIEKMGYDHTCFATAIINLAVKGYLKINEDDDGDYTLTKTGKTDITMAPGESAIANALFNNNKSIKLEQSNHSKIRKAIQAQENSLKNNYEKMYFVKNSKFFLIGIVLTIITIIITFFLHSSSMEEGTIFLIVWLTFWSFGVVILVTQVKNAWISVKRKVSFIFPALFISAFATPFVAAEVYVAWLVASMAGFSMMILVLVAVAINWLFYELLKAPTLAGRELLDKIEGFRNYIELAEKNDLDYRYPGGRTPELFEKFLPYALALGLEQVWARQFADVLAAANAGRTEYSPTWYQGSHWNSANLAGFTSSLGSSLSSAISSSSTAPGSSSGGGGGGSSGGGGGGGGGGGW